MTKSNSVRKGCMWLVYLDHNISWREARARTQGKNNLEVGSEAESMKEGCLLASPPDIFNQLSYTVQDRTSAWGWYHTWWAGPSSINYQDRWANLIQTVLWLIFPPPRRLGCVTIKTKQDKEMYQKNCVTVNYPCVMTSQLSTWYFDYQWLWVRTID